MRIDIRHNPMEGIYPLTLCAIVHDEMYFLPEFFAYYRGLGVDRFVVLDDASVDGTSEFLAGQPDCMVLRSDVRYFDLVDGARAIYAWRQALMERFCLGQWAIFADADEFLALPPDETAASVTARLERQRSDSIWGVMVDMYPAAVADIRAGRPFRLADPWYFDAGRHIVVRAGRRKPVSLYRGSRARLMGASGMLEPAMSWSKRAAIRLGLGGYVKRNVIYKIPLVRWTGAHRFDGSHQIEPAPRTNDHLAILHFKFTGDLGRKVAYALETGGYFDGSRQYDELGRLLARMEGRGASFLARRSRRFTSGADLYTAGVGRWSA
jgi:glycosyl transferase family 2